MTNATFRRCATCNRLNVYPILKCVCQQTPTNESENK